jgi:hypothetical protein
VPFPRHCCCSTIEDIFLYESDPEAEHPFKGGLVVEVTFDDPRGGGIDSAGM